MKKLLVSMLALVLAFSITAGTAEVYTITPPVPAKAEFALSSNPTTGFQWFAHLIKDGVVTLSDSNGSYVSDETDQILCGSGGTQYFTITAVAPGETILVLDYMRPFAPLDRMTEAYLITVDTDGQLYVRDLAGASPRFGTVLSVDTQNHSALVIDENEQQLLVFIEEAQALPVKGEEILIWFNGTMTYSIPAQLHAMGWESMPSDIAR